MNPFHNTLKHDFEEWVSSKLISTNTRRAYENEIKKLCKWLVSEKKIETYCGLQDISMNEFLIWVMRHKKGEKNNGQNPKTIEQTRRISYAFLGWLAKSGKVTHGEGWEVRPHKVKVPKNFKIEWHLDKGIDQDEIKEKLRVLKLSKKDLDDGEVLRCKLMANLAFWSCATTSEIQGLNVDSVTISGGKLEVKFGGQKNRNVALPTHLAVYMKKYIESRVKVSRNAHTCAKALFTGGDDSRINIWSIRRAISGIGKGSQKSSMTPQRLRRTFLEVARRGGVNFEELAYQSGRRAMQIKAATKGVPLKVINSYVID